MNALQYKHTLGRLLILTLACLVFGLGFGRSAEAAWGSDKLEKWMDKELYPYLKERLGQHPRLKGQPFSIVAMDGDDTLSEINGLSEWLRENIREELQTAPGVKLVWRPTVKPWNHPRSLADLNCESAMNVDIQIGIDARWDEMEEELKVSVRALDLKEGAWVSGFGLRYAGKMTRKQKDALQRSEKDEHLRGLKPLPFASNQADLLASYLARNLSCLLRDGDGSQFTLYAPAPAGEVPRLFATTLGIVDNYLGQFREVRLSNDPVEADVILQTEVYPIDKSTGLYQVWIDVKRQSNDAQISGSQTQAYVQLSQSDMADLVQGVGAGGGGAAGPATDWSRTEALIGSAHAVTVASPGLCKSDKPWMLGQQQISANDKLASGGCFALKIAMAQSADLYVFSQNNSGQMTRLLPSSCNALGGDAGQRVQGGQQLHLPQNNGANSVLILDNQTGTERFHIVAVDDEAAKVALEKRIKDIPDVCTGKMSSRETVKGFEAAIAKLHGVTKGHVDWKKIQFGHR